MRQVNKTVNIYKFDELEPDIQQKAIDNYRNYTLDNCDSFWCEYILEDIKTFASLFGLEIDNIYYSGFWSQGDGASFEGHYEYKKNSLNAVKEFCPIDHDLHEIVKSLCNLQKRHFYKLQANTKVTGHYVQSYCMTVDTYNYNKYGGWPDKEESEEMTDILRQFADYIYDKLYKEYDWLTSDENIRELLEDYEFLENGEQYGY